MDEDKEEMKIDGKFYSTQEGIKEIHRRMAEKGHEVERHEISKMMADSHNFAKDKLDAHHEALKAIYMPNNTREVVELNVNSITIMANSIKHLFFLFSFLREKCPGGLNKFTAEELKMLDDAIEENKKILRGEHDV